MYYSTRDKNISPIQKPASLAILEGIAKDGGLYVTKINKVFDEKSIEELRGLSYKKLAYKILRYFLDDFSDDDILEVIEKSYNDTFDTDEIVKFKEVDERLAFLELYHGKTLAFKDVALSLLPNLMAKSKEINKVHSKTIILTATSGDTGSAALSGYSTHNDVKMIVLYPNKGVSKIQERQMLSFANDSKKVVAINGNFDDAQTLVKEIFNDKEMGQYNLSSANSINIGRLIPQIVYYFYSYFKFAKKNEKINFVVPTGNFGNILAGFIAKEMGLPVNKLICASNSNDVLYEFFNTKTYNKQRKFIKTISPSMDILVSSNLERLLYYKSNSAEEVYKCMEELKTKGEYKVNFAFPEFASEKATEEETQKGIKDVYAKYHYLIDPHTAVAYCAYKKYQDKASDNVKTIVLSTASPLKFPETICKALDLPYTDEISSLDTICEKCQIIKPQVLEKLNQVKQENIWDKDKASTEIKKVIRSLCDD